MNLEALVQEIRLLSVAERKQLIMVILDSFIEEQPAKTHSVLEFEGATAHLRDMDAQEYVNQLRREWDERP